MQTLNLTPLGTKIASELQPFLDADGRLVDSAVVQYWEGGFWQGYAVVGTFSVAIERAEEAAILYSRVRVVSYRDSSRVLAFGFTLPA